MSNPTNKPEDQDRTVSANDNRPDEIQQDGADSTVPTKRKKMDKPTPDKKVRRPSDEYKPNIYPLY